MNEARNKSSRLSRLTPVSPPPPSTSSGPSAVEMLFQSTVGLSQPLFMSLLEEAALLSVLEADPLWNATQGPSHRASRGKTEDSHHTRKSTWNQAVA